MVLAKAERVRRYMSDHPGITSPSTIASALERHGVTIADVSNVKRQLAVNGNGHHETNGNGHAANDSPVSVTPPAIDWHRVKECRDLANQLVQIAGGKAAATECIESLA